MRRTNPPKPRLRSEHFNVQYPYSEFTKQQIQDIFDDEAEIDNQIQDPTNVGTQNVDGWSFVKMTQSHIEMVEESKGEGKTQFSVAGNTQNQNII